MESWVLLTPSQYGFRNAHSAQHAIPDIVNAIRTNMNNRLFSCGIFIDLKKAFDTADHEILLRKSDHYGFRGIINIWFSSYLQGRTQTTQIGPHISERLDSTCGVPQGSVLGPLLFLLYINNIQESSDKLSFIFLRMIQIIFCPAQRKLSYQPKIVIFDNKQNKKVALEHKDYVKYLRILIDKNLSWKHHIDHIIIQVSWTVGLIAKLRHFLPTHILLNIYIPTHTLLNKYIPSSYSPLLNIRSDIMGPGL